MREAGFKVLDHPADMGISVTAPSLLELYRQAFLGLVNTLLDNDSIEEIFEDEIVVSSLDREHLMFDWLSEILFQFDCEGRIYRDVDLQIEALEGDESTLRLRARARGQEFDASIHQIKTYVKAITLHQLSVKGDGDDFEATIYLDI
ncbi:MAG: archease [Cyanobacteriota/Melainabacteria group bacterium]